MTGFKLDKFGDVVMDKGSITMVSDDELIQQKCKTILGTNKKEWFLNEDEGIDFKNILTKNPNLDLICDEIREGLMQVDETFTVDEFNCTIKGRTLFVSFIAVNSNGFIVKGEQSYGG